MNSRRKAYGRLGALALVVVVLAACSGSNATWPPDKPSGGPLASAVHVVVPGDSGAGPSQPVASGAPRATVEAVTVDQITANYVYTSELVTPIAHLYGTFIDDFVVVTITNNNSAAVKVVVTSEINGYTDTATDTVMVNPKGTEEVRQNPRLTTSAIDGLNSQHQADLHVVVSYLDAGQPRTVLDQTSETLVTSRRDVPWTIKGMTQQEDYNLVAAMVTPTDPSVEHLIRDAANYDPTHQMAAGYDSENDQNGTVLQRLADVWQSETTDFNLTYINTPITFASGSSQRIRLPGEVLDQSSGNCIELTLLYASVVEGLGMQPVIIIIPGHAYVAVRVDDTNASYYFIETTLIGQATFSDATATGLSEWQKAQPHVEAGEAEYGWVDVKSARADGIVPIPWR
jgi:hypothetical protein